MYEYITVNQLKNDQVCQLEAVLKTGASLSKLIEETSGYRAHKYIINALNYQHEKQLSIEEYTIGAIKNLTEFTEEMEVFSALPTKKMRERIILEENKRKQLFAKCFRECRNDDNWIQRLSKKTALKALNIILDAYKITETKDLIDLKEWIKKYNNQLLLIEAIESTEKAESLDLEITQQAPSLHSYQGEAIAQLQQDIQKPFAIEEILSQLVLPTGSGKTRVANEYVVSFFKTRNKQVIWFAPNWILLKQAHDALLMLCPALKNNVRRLGGNNQHLSNISNRIDQDCKIIYTTSLTLANRIGNSEIEDLDLSLDFMIYDECHWGLNSQSFLTIYDYCKDNKIKILGLTATPKEFKQQKTKIIYRKSYSELLNAKILAQPWVYTVDTNQTWNPIFRNNLVTQASLNELNTKERNDVILKKLCEVLKDRNNARVLVFACSIEHADALNFLFTQNNISSRSVHSAIEKNAANKMLQDFRDGKINVIVNVLQLTHGFDLPEIDTIFLARPAESDVLCAQMVGRGARRTSNKTDFFIYDFHDILSSFNQRIFFDVNGLFDGCTLNNRNGANINYNKPRHHESDEYPQFEILIGEDFGGLQGLKYVCNQTFGIEIELTSITGVPEWDSSLWNNIAEEIISCLTQSLGDELVYQIPNYYHETPDAVKINQWHLEYDSSVGWELISPILKGIDGFRQIVLVCKSLKEYIETNPSVCVSYNTGLHVTLATRLKKDVHIKAFLQRVRRLEPGLFTLVAPSRLYEYCSSTDTYKLNNSNEYCRPIRKIKNSDIDLLSSGRFSSRNDLRYFSVNVSKWQETDEYFLIEVRMHNGTIEENKIIPWICLWMKIFNVSAYRWKGDEVNIKHVFPEFDAAPKTIENEDIFKLLEKEDIFISAKMRCLLHERRKLLAMRWRRAIPNHVDAWEADGWYETIKECQPKIRYITEVISPNTCPHQKIDLFVSLVKEGGEVSETGLQFRVENSHMLALTYAGNEIIGVGALKNPDVVYSENVFKNTSENFEEYPLELGWIYIKPEFREKGIATEIVSKLLEKRDGKGVFMTSRTDTLAMTKIAFDFGFQKIGTPRKSSIDKSRFIQLYVRKKDRDDLDELYDLFDFES